jgi:hypothetical protein
MGSGVRKRIGFPAGPRAAPAVEANIYKRNQRKTMNDRINQA